MFKKNISRVENPDLHPAWAWGHTKLAMNKELGGHYKEALEAAAHTEELTDGWGSALLQSWLAGVYALSGKPKLAQRSLKRMLDHAEYEYVDPYALATAYAYLEDKQNTLKWLEKAVGEKVPNAVYMRGLKMLVPQIADDARLKALVRRMKFPQ